MNATFKLITKTLEKELTLWRKRLEKKHSKERLDRQEQADLDFLNGKLPDLTKKEDRHA
jgi:hypothetical protein